MTVLVKSRGRLIEWHLKAFAFISISLSEKNKISVLNLGPLSEEEAGLILTFELCKTLK
jgi:hypothetical protein